MAIAPTLPNLADTPAAVDRENGSWFQLSLGTLSGRVPSATGYMMVLGQLQSYDLATLITGDYIEMTQEDVDLDGVDYITFPAQVIGRALAAPTVEWVASIIIDGVVYAEKKFSYEKTINWSDFRVPVTLITGTASVTVRLTLAEV